MPKVNEFRRRDDSMGRLKALSLGAAIVLAGAVLTACSGDDSASPSVSTSSEPSSRVESTTTIEPSTLAASSSAASAFAPNVGVAALRIGEQRRGSAFTTRLTKFRYPYPPSEYRDPAKRREFFGLRVRECLLADGDIGSDPAYSTYNGEWFVVTPGGAQFTSSSSWDDWPAPKFPENANMTPGECVQGWMTVEVPKGTQVEKIVYRTAGQTVAEWLP